MNSASSALPISTIVTKETWIAYILWFFLGILGIHKFYVNKTGWGILYLFTGGIIGIGLLIDLFTIPSQVRNYNQGISPGGCWR